MRVRRRLQHVLAALDRVECAQMLLPPLGEQRFGLAQSAPQLLGKRHALAHATDRPGQLLTDCIGQARTVPFERGLRRRLALCAFTGASLRVAERLARGRKLDGPETTEHLARRKGGHFNP